MKWRNGSPLPATYTAAAPALRASVELHIACAAPKGPPDGARCVIGCQRERERVNASVRIWRYLQAFALAPVS